MQIVPKTIQEGEFRSIQSFKIVEQQPQMRRQNKYPHNSIYLLSLMLVCVVLNVAYWIVSVNIVRNKRNFAFMWVIAISLFLCVALVITLIILVRKIYKTTNPIPVGYSQRKFNLSNLMNSQYNVSGNTDNKRLFVMGSQNRFIKLCSSCNIYLTTRIAHCRQCQRCYAYHDHHCSWLGCCISHSNYKYFIGLLFTLSGIFILLIFCDLIILAQLGYTLSKFFQISFTVLIIAGGVLFLIQIIALIYELQLLLFHTYLLYKGISTRQYYHTSIRHNPRFCYKLHHSFPSHTQNPQSDYELIRESNISKNSSITLSLKSNKESKPNKSPVLQFYEQQLESQEDRTQLDFSEIGNKVKQLQTLTISINSKCGEDLNLEDDY